ncbi:MAG: hypothetical protein BM556_00400 [Bacteriovorax sp. MedPE-SWde]|nr:MAG: hypothetical protein BM556_00400 [Bacteriovorax sp. MedPE-SWde]
MSLKDAMMKAGLKSTKSQNERDRRPAKTVKKIEKHQETRNFCEVCQFIQPDVERYKHKNPTIDAEWICAACADKNDIHDQFRMTNQSEFAKSKRFRREFGPTKVFSNNHRAPAVKKSEMQKEANFNINDDGEKNFNC